MMKPFLFTFYAGNNLENENCDAPSPYQTSPEIKTAAVDLHIFIDTTWPFVEIQSSLACVPLDQHTHTHIELS